TYATGDPVNHTDPTGQSPEDAWNWFQNSWFNKEVLGWEGMPYLDIALAGAGLAAATIASGGTLTIPVAIAAGATLATTAAAADQIAINTTGAGLVSDSVRTALDITALAGGITGGLIGAKKAPQAAHKIGNALKSKFGSGAPMEVSQSTDSLSDSIVRVKSEAVRSAEKAVDDIQAKVLELSGKGDNAFFAPGDRFGTQAVAEYRAKTGMSDAFAEGGPTIYEGVHLGQDGRVMAHGSWVWENGAYVPTPLGRGGLRIFDEGVPGTVIFKGDASLPSYAGTRMPVGDNRYMLFTLHTT
ncbi:hypothetical protein ACFV6B_41185, partial [Streptomyces microflavus]|uniref:hypothetical protein n=1 Tax=Streptomyces microflavus TaxID=1919 RepID=UPI0036577BCC